MKWYEIGVNLKCEMNWKLPRHTHCTLDSISNTAAHFCNVFLFFFLESSLRRQNPGLFGLRKAHESQVHLWFWREAPETLLSLSRTLAPGYPNCVSTKMLKLPGMLRLPCRFQHNKNHKMHAVSSPSSIIHLPLVIFYNASIYLMPPLPRFQWDLTSTTTEITAPWGPQLLVLRFDHCTVVPCYPTTSMPRSISNMFDHFGFHSAKF